MDTIKLTTYIVGGCFIALALYDVYVAMNKKEGDTISEVIRNNSYKYPIVSFVAGFICGHWFW